MPQFPPNEAKLLRDVLAHQAKLEMANLALVYFREDLYKYDSATPKFYEMIKYFYEARFKLAREVSKLTILKAEFGIVGKNWYNSNT